MCIHCWARAFAAILATVAMLAVLPASAQPFGIAMGTKEADLKMVGEVRPHYFMVVPPNTHPDLEIYLVTVTPENGVCSIEGVSHQFRNDADGSLAKATFARIGKQLQDQYGPSKTYDFLHAGSIWTRSIDWATSLGKNERSYNRYWSAEFKSRLPSDVSVIHLSVEADRDGKTRVSLYYEMANSKACEKSVVAGAGAL